MSACPRVLIAVLLLAVAGCSRQKPPPAAPPQPASGEISWRAFADAFIAERFEADPYFAVQAGRHEFDGRMPDWSRAAFDADLAQLRTRRQQLDAFDPATLSAEDRFDREVVTWVIDSEIFWRARAEFPFRNPAWYLDRLDPSVYLTRDYAPLRERLRGFLGHARALPGLAASIRANLRTPMPRAYIDHGVDGFAGYATFYRDEAPQAYASIEDAALKAELDDAMAAAAEAMKGLATWLEGLRASATDDFALGAPLYSEMLRVTERLDMPLEELELIARRDLERNLAALREACAVFAPRVALAGCVERMRANKPAGGSVAGARRQIDQLRRFVVDKQLATVPDVEQAQVAESPPYNRGNFAYISIPGPYDGPAVKSTYYYSPPDPSWSAAERQAFLPGRAYLLFVSAHEVWPGHYLQSVVAHAGPPRAATLWWNYAFGEGWAHYTEEMMYDAGLGAGDPEMRVGMLTNALLRNVRFVSAICLHTGCMTPAESEDMFRRQAFADAGNARQQAARGTYDPGYLAYTLGKLMIRKLRADWLAAHPGADLRQFHDRFLSYGAPPVPLVRREMLGTPDGAL